MNEIAVKEIPHIQTNKFNRPDVRERGEEKKAHDLSPLLLRQSAKKKI